MRQTHIRNKCVSKTHIRQTREGEAVTTTLCHKTRSSAVAERPRDV